MRLQPHWLQRPAVAWTLIVLIALGSGYAASDVYRLVQEERFLNTLAQTTQGVAAQIEMETMAGYAVGVARLLGLNEPRLRELVTGQWEPDAPAVLERLTNAQQLLAVDGIYVLDAEGLVLAHATREATKTTGRNLAFRPWFAHAMQGQTTLYAAVGSRSSERGLYVASPLYATPETGAPVIGVILLKMPGEFLDQRLASAGHQGLLIAPQGVTFAATESRWLLRLVGESSPERLTSLQALRQFGADYQYPETVRQLPFVPHERVTRIDGRCYGFATASVDWNDPAGLWTLVQFENLALVSGVWPRLGVGGLTGAVMFALGWMLWTAACSRRMRTEALIRQEVATTELAQASAQKQKLAEFTMQMQEAESLEALAHVFFQHLANLLPIHQGTLYVTHNTTDDNEGLRLMGAYGTHQVPDAIEPGDGLLAACGQQRRPLVFTDPPAGFWRIATGLGEMCPRTLLLFPLLRKQRLLGVLELASAQQAQHLQSGLIDGLLPLLAINLDIHLTIQRDARTLADCRAAIAKLEQSMGTTPEPLNRETTHAKDPSDGSAN